MKRYILISVMVFAGVMQAQAQDNDVVLDEIIAIVNDGVVLRSEIAAESLFLASQARSSNQNLPSIDVLADRVRERLINQEIQRQRAATLGIAVDEASVNQAIEQVASNNNMTTFEFRSTLRNEGFNYDHYRETIRHELLLNRLIQREVEQTINVSEQEIDDYLANASAPNAENLQYRLRHILIAEASSSSTAALENARNKATSLIARLRDGADFATIAATESDGTRALQGGDLGWRKLRELPRFLHDPVANISEGTISDPIQSQDGFHIIRVEGTRVGDQAPDIETRARHIYISTAGDGSATNDDQAQLILAEVEQRLRKGEDFGKLASEFSDDTNSASNGGELPWFIPGQMPAQIEQQASQLQPDGISSPFRTQFGWHLLQVLERRNASSSDERKRQEAELGLRERKLEQETDRWSRRIRSEAYVEILK